MTGMTNKQFSYARFYRALDNYKAALASGDSRAIVLSSLAIHVAKGEVSKRLWPLVGRAYRETKAPILTTGNCVAKNGSRDSY